AVVAARLAAGLAAVEDVLVRDRLAGLAWLAHEGRLELRVVLPVDDRGVPLSAEEAEPYFHVKFGVFHDAAGDRVAFEGSVNETAAGWSQNFEQLSVFFSWDESCRYVTDIEARFERLWENRERGWRTLTLPEAVRQALLRYRPPEPPLSDPLEPVTAAVGEETEAYDAGADTRVSRAIARFLLDAPRLVGARGLGLATAPIEPWPHQRRVVERLVGSFPERF
ncbi:MAG: phospholipase D-like domain-containing protein, partial [Thermomicrobium sp.]|nr:phospholipase D-like domain-containing protein [Thermomicrobium sp.]